MKTLAGALLFTLCVHILHAQPVVSVGKPYEVIDADAKYYFSKGNEIIAVKVDAKNGVSIQKLRADNLMFQKIRVYDDFPKQSVVEKVTEFDGKYYLFYSSWNGEQEQLFSREIDLTKGEFTGPGVKCLTVNKKISGEVTSVGFYRVGVVNKFNFYFSSDSSRLLIQYRLKPESKSDAKNYDIIGMGAYDRDLKASWSREVKMPYTEKKMDNLDYVVDRKANAYIVALVYDDNTTNKMDAEGNPNYAIEILKMTPDGKDLTKHPIALPDKFIKTLWIYENPNGFLVCGGFYSKEKDAENADGILLFRLSEEGKVLDVATYEIPVEILNQYVKAKTQRKNERKDEKDKAEFEDLALREIRFAKDGSMLLISEQYFSKVHIHHSQNGGTSHSTTYHYNDMLVAKISATGKLEWMRKLPKRQKGGRGQGSMSYKYIMAGNSHYLLFLDNEHNRDLSIDKLPAAHADGEGGFLTAYKIDDGSGKVEKVYILNTRDIKGEEVFQFRTSRIVATGATEYVFEVYKKKKEDILVKVKM